MSNFEGLRRLDVAFVRAAEALRVLPALAADNAASERARLVACASRRLPAEPKWIWRRPKLDANVGQWLDEARRFAEGTPVARAYLAKLDELELDAAILHAIGDDKRVRMLAVRRYGSGRDVVPTRTGEGVEVRAVASELLSKSQACSEPRTVPAEVVAVMLRAAAHEAGIDVQVRIEPKLAAGAAAGDRVLWIAARRFGEKEAKRLIAHEVLGHLVASANARLQPLRIFEHGFAGALTDQEGLAIHLEELTGTLDGHRVRILAGRVLAADWMYAGAPFADVVHRLLDTHGFEPFDAVSIAERAFRGGGVARDVMYLVGWLRVRHALERGDSNVDELRVGKVALGSLLDVRAWQQARLAVAAAHRPDVVRDRPRRVRTTPYAAPVVRHAEED